MRNTALVLNDWVKSVLDSIIILTNIIITALTVFMVITRYFLGWSIIGLHELTLILAMWLYMSGAIVASMRSEHLVVDFISQRITSLKWKMLHQRFIAVIMVATIVFFLILSWNMLSWSLKRPQVTAALSIPLLVSQAAIITASIGCFVYALRDMLTTTHRSHNQRDNLEEEIG